MILYERQNLVQTQFHLNFIKATRSCSNDFLLDYVYAIGGHDNNKNQYLNTCERSVVKIVPSLIMPTPPRFSMCTGSWEQGPKLRVARRSPGVVTYKGAIYAVGGMGSKKDLTSM